MAPLEIRIEYEVADHRYCLAGVHLIEVLPRDATPTTVNAYIGNRITQTGDGPQSGGAYNQVFNVDLSGLGTTDKVADVIAKLKKERGLHYENVVLCFETAAPPATAQPVASPDWPPTDRARLWFTHEGICHNYCLLAKPGLAFGRDKAADVRLYEVEYCRANLRRQAEAGLPPERRQSGSRVGRAQWKVAPRGNGIQVTQCSQRGRSTVTGGKQLEAGESVVLGRNEEIAIEDAIGLRYAANAPALDGLEAARQLARLALDAMPEPPRAQPPWPGPFGGYRLARLYSLAGRPPAIGEDLNTLEAYVLAPGWVTLGASQDACIVVPGAEELHAAILHVDGYWFLYPIAENARTRVAGQAACPGVPVPLAPGTALELGPTQVVLKVSRKCSCDTKATEAGQCPVVSD